VSAKYKAWSSGQSEPANALGRIGRQDEPLADPLLRIRKPNRSADITRKRSLSPTIQQLEQGVPAMGTLSGVKWAHP
jgi:hypothetical protein